MNYIKVLGASGSKTKDMGTTSFQVFRNIIIDAGNVINTLGNNAKYIDHIFLTHSHSDHIIDLPFLVEGFFEQRTKSITVYASKETINSIKKHTFNDEIWPDFSKIPLLKSNEKAIIFHELKEHDVIHIDSYAITAIKANHIPGSFGYTVVKDDKCGYAISGDTYICDELYQTINENKKIKSLIVECSFPSNMEDLAKSSLHLTPKLLSEELKKLTRKDIQIFLYHLKPLYIEDMKKEIQELGILNYGGKVLEENDVIHIDTGNIESNTISHNKFEKIMDINLELSSQLDRNILFEKILTLTRELTDCEAGTLYIVSNNKKRLEFKVVQNDPLNIHMGGTASELDWNPLPLYMEDESKNLNMVATVVALEQKTVNISDVYNTKKYDFEGTRKFDKMTGYRSKSMLVIPLTNHENEVIGVLQLINKTKATGQVIDFNKDDERIIKALASQAAMTLTNTHLINSLEEFLNSFITTIAHAIDAKSPHTRNHIGKVAKIARLLAEEIDKDTTIYKDVNYSANDYREIELAAWMHDVGKISMPEHIIDKPTKLATITDRIERIKERFEVLKRDSKIELLENKISTEEYEKRILQLENDFKFIEETNIGEEFMDEEKLHRIEEISNYEYYKQGELTKLLTDNEKYNLSIRKGTLTEEEKHIMNSHARLSLEMLSKLPFPKKYNNVLNIAVNHHEKLNGEGYPRGLTDKELTLEDRIMILADIFEALTARDRPYKDGKKLSEVFKILSFMAKDNEIDKNLLEFFANSSIIPKYAKEELKQSQIDNYKVNL